MSKMRKGLIAAAIAAFAALVVWAVVTVPETPDLPDTPAESNKTMSYDGNEISEERNGRKIWDLTAEHIDVNIETRDAVLEKLQGHFYAEDGRVVEVKAGKGTYAEGTKDIVLSDNVEIKNSDGAQLTCDELRWDAQKEILAAIGNAKAVKEDMLATGDRIESSDGFNKIKISGKAHLRRGGETE